ncbi:MAG TPA: hypothetical protein VNJ08_09740 [Bacteriovoracaceae bacterium]|nr:hypothetical protein [Bacteriovoracaceae bacterium]
MKFLTMLAFVLSLSGQVMACSEDGSTGIVPENDLNIPVGAKTLGGITEEEFNNVITKLEDIYLPIAKSMGGDLKIARKWTDGTVNANATRMGSSWNVNMYGGLARHASITADGFSLVLCHEIGHHLGGAPKVGGFFNFNRWASNEGQADYYATLKCLRQLYLNDNNPAIVAKLNAPEELVKACRKAWSNKDDSSICIRSGMAGASVASLFAVLRSKPEGNFGTPDTNVVKKTYDAHPAHQCRLDTYFQGALCDKTIGEEVSQKDEVKGTCHSSTGHTTGVRPLCWFKSSVN